MRFAVHCTCGTILGPYESIGRAFWNAIKHVLGGESTCDPAIQEVLRR